MKVTTRYGLLSLTAAFLLAWLPALGADDGKTARPNIVIFLTDDQGYGDLGYHGNSDVTTPQLDAFAREAVQFTNFHVSPVCSLTRASLMTGRYTFRTGVCDVFREATCMDPAKVTRAEALRSAGYATGLFGKWHLGDDPTRCPTGQGFGETLTFAGGVMRHFAMAVALRNHRRGDVRGRAILLCLARAEAS